MRLVSACLSRTAVLMRERSRSSFLPANSARTADLISLVVVLLSVQNPDHMCRPCIVRCIDLVSAKELPSSAGGGNGLFPFGDWVTPWMNDA